MKLAAKEFQEAYKELILEDDFSLSLYIKNNNLSISAAEAFKKEFIISTHIHIERNFSEDFLLSPELSCERIHWLEIRDRLESKKFLEFWATMNPFIDIFSKILNEQADIYNMYYLGDTIISYTERNIELPLNLSSDAKDAAISCFNRFNDLILYGSNEQGKLATHTFLHHILQYVSEVKSFEAKVFIPDKALFFAINRMLLLDYYSKEPLTIEIYYENNEKVLRFKRGLEYVIAPECENACSLEKFSKALAGRIFQNDKSLRYRCKVVGDPPKRWYDYWPYAVAGIGVMLFFYLNIKGALWTANSVKTHIQ